MYQILLILHSINRWLVLVSLLYAIWIAWTGWRSGRGFAKKDDTIRHVTATISHIQLLLGLSLYMISPVVKFAGVETPGTLSEHTFFRLIHLALMVVAVVVITIGSARAKRVSADRDKYVTMLVWFALGLLIIFIAIPWPFSPLAQRPYLRF